MMRWWDDYMEDFYKGPEDNVEVFEKVELTELSKI